MASTLFTHARFAMAYFTIVSPYLTACTMNSSGNPTIVAGRVSVGATLRTLGRRSSHTRHRKLQRLRNLPIPLHHRARIIARYRRLRASHRLFPSSTLHHRDLVTAPARNLHILATRLVFSAERPPVTLEPAIVPADCPSASAALEAAVVLIDAGAAVAETAAGVAARVDDPATDLAAGGETLAGAGDVLHGFLAAGACALDKHYAGGTGFAVGMAGVWLWCPHRRGRTQGWLHFGIGVLHGMGGYKTVRPQLQDNSSKVTTSKQS
ncbi:hypothetical protein BJ742DRAFT_309201 [Cladochytrium replicatum]|nr:hypothetical protein BJ742DRAFT_309201 [Cladochytrium replicatum]